MRNDGYAENEKRTISYGPLPSFLRSLDACFNYFLHGVPNDHNHTKIQNAKTLEIERTRLIAARCELLHLPNEKIDNSSLGTTGSFTHISHIQQEDIWDCGVTCMIMIIRYLKHLEKKHESIIDENDISSLSLSSSLSSSSLSSAHIERLQKSWILNKLQTQSIWTIDLVMLLESIFNDEAPETLKFPKRCLPNGYNVKYLYCSNNLGVDETYKGLNYYKNAFGNDEKRVKKLFKLAQREKIPMLKVSHIDIEFVVQIVSRDNCVAVVLVDYSTFGTGITSTIGEKTKSSSTEFSGHYVILSGISRDKNDIAKANKFSDIKDSTYCMVINNPGCADEHTFVGKELFERSWRATGTDCDILFLAVNKDLRQKK